MIFKYTGLLLIAISISMYGTKKSSALINTYKIKLEIANLIKTIEHSVKFGAIPIDKALNSYSSPLLEKCGFLDLLRKGNSNTEEIKEVLMQAGYEDSESTCEFFSKIGKSCCCENELILCSKHLAIFEQTLKSDEKEVKEKAQLYKKLSLIISILTIIIFI